MASYVPIGDVLGAPNLFGMIELTVNGLLNPFPKEFMRVESVADGDVGEWRTSTGARQNASVTEYGGPSRTRQLRDVGSQPVKLMHVCESITLPVKDYMNLLEYENLTKQNMGFAEVARQAGYAGEYVGNFRISALTSALFLQNIYIDKTGNVLPSATNASVTIPFDIPAGNTGQLNVFGTGNILDVGWQNPTAQIDKQIIALRQASVRLTGYELGLAFYGKNVPVNLAKNNNLAPYFVRATNDQQSFNPKYIASGELPNPLLGLTWLPAYLSYFIDQNNNAQSFVGDDQVLFCPRIENTSKWLGWIDGTYPVPKKYGISDPAQVIAENFEKKAGRFAYGVPTFDPCSAKIVYGDTTIPAIKIPNVLFCATTAFGS